MCLQFEIQPTIKQKSIYLDQYEIHQRKVAFGKYFSIFLLYFFHFKCIYTMSNHNQSKNN